MASRAQVELMVLDLYRRERVRASENPEAGALQRSPRSGRLVGFLKASLSEIGFKGIPNGHPPFWGSNKDTPLYM